jgi:hypothetical protein
MEFTNEQLTELKHCINSNIGMRIQYDSILDEGKRKDNNSNWLKQDYELLEMVLKEQDRRKSEEEQC